MTKSILEIAKETRREVMGQDYIDKLDSEYNDFNREFLEEIALTNVWGRSWSRGVLSHRELSLINIAMLIALGRTAEFKLHFRNALLRTHVPIEALREILIHVSVYCGVPAGRTAFEVAEQVMREAGIDPSKLKIPPVGAKV